MIRGIGPVYAKKLVRAFGDAVFDIIQQEPDRPREVTGIGPRRADRIVAGWAEQKVIREIMLFLHSNGDPAVVIPLTTQHYPMLQRNLVYTGVTRGKRLVVLEGPGDRDQGRPVKAAVVEAPGMASQKYLN
jgi:ATP-dependent exoDNAse (exonuclease V) alpha subunit